MFDISEIKSLGRSVEIVHPADPTIKLGIRISLVSMNDERVKKIRRKIQDEKLRLESRGKSFKADDVESNTNELLFSAMTGWEWYNPTGKPGDKEYNEERQAAWKGNKSPEFNRANVMSILNDPSAYWIGDQISEALSEEKAFFSNSKTI